MALVEAHDLAFGTSRWSSKLVHGGLRYLAHGELGLAHESAVERGILMTRTAPHLTRAMPQLFPLYPSTSRAQQALVAACLRAGDALRRAARTPSSVLPRPRSIPAAEALALAPGLSPAGLRGALLAYDGALVDDARLVVSLARTAASVLKGRKVSPKVRVLVVPGSQEVKRQAIAEGLPEVFREAGCEWREPGCSMCIAMNGDQLSPGQYAVSTSNRNFEGRQGKGGRTFLASPLTAAATAVTGRVADVRSLI